MILVSKTYGVWEKVLRKSVLVSLMMLLLASFLTVMATLPLRVHAVPEIYMTPSNNPPLPGPYVGFRWNITIWIEGYGDPPIFAWMVTLNYDPAVGIEVTRAWLPADDPGIFFGRQRIRPPIFPIIKNGSVIVSEALLVGPGETPPPDPAKLVIIEFNITKAPGRLEVLHTNLEINNDDTYILDDAFFDVPVIKTDGSYTYAYARAWDITGSTEWIPDGKCDIRDVAIIAVRFGSEEGDEMYDSRADVTGPIYLEKDGKIDIRDIALVALHFGETC